MILILLFQHHRQNKQQDPQQLACAITHTKTIHMTERRLASMAGNEYTDRNIIRA